MAFDSDLTDKIVGLAIGAIILAAVGATAIGMIEDTNTTTWGTATAALWGVVGVFIVIAVVRWFIKK